VPPRLVGTRRATRDHAEQQPGGGEENGDEEEAPENRMRARQEPGLVPNRASHGGIVPRAFAGRSTIADTWR
jgi:hypothetical protein